MLRVGLRSKRWPDGRLLLHDIGFRVQAGEVVALSGPSGCGKSTLLAIVAGLDHDYDGEIEWKGAPRLGFVFQTPRLLPWRTVIDNVVLAMGGGSAARTKAAAALELVGLGESMDAYPSRLSLGMARRAALARALAIEPDVLLLDEAFVSLDQPTAEKMREAVMSEVARRALTVVMVSHDPSDAARMAGRVLTLGGNPTSLVSIEPAVRPIASPTTAQDGPGSCPP